MELETVEQLCEMVKEAEYLLIGIGEEWTYSLNELLILPDFLTDLDKMKDVSNQDFILSNLQKKYYESFQTCELKRAYQSLYQLCKDKDYFLISMNYDRYPILAGFSQEKCVFPCGNLQMLQCDNNCQNSLMSAQEEYEKAIKVLNGEIDGKSIEQSVCPFCGEKIVYNTIEANKYCEGGYLEQWDKYMKFLQKTINKKLCLIELGVSMRFPEVIRNAFEKTTFYNQKANLIRIHSSLADVPQTIKDKSFIKHEDSVAYFGNMFVS